MSTTQKSPSKTIENIKASMFDKYGLQLKNGDIYLADKIIYITTGKVAELFRVSHHCFSTKYVFSLTCSGVRRITLGRSKFYCLSDILDRLKKVMEKGETIFEVCEKLIKKSKTKKK